MSRNRIALIAVAIVVAGAGFAIWAFYRSGVLPQTVSVSQTASVPQTVDSPAKPAAPGEPSAGVTPSADVTRSARGRQTILGDHAAAELKRCYPGTRSLESLVTDLESRPGDKMSRKLNFRNVQIKTSDGRILRARTSRGRGVLVFEVDAGGKAVPKPVPPGETLENFLSQGDLMDDESSYQLYAGLRLAGEINYENGAVTRAFVFERGGVLRCEAAGESAAADDSASVDCDCHKGAHD